MTDYTKAEAALDAAHESGIDRTAKAVAEGLHDPEWLESALRHAPPETWMLIVQLLGDMAADTDLDVDTTTEAMREEILLDASMLGGAVRNAAALWAMAPIGE